MLEWVLVLACPRLVNILFPDKVQNYLSKIKHSLSFSHTVHLHWCLSSADQRVKRNTEASLRSLQAGNREEGNMALRVGSGRR